MRSGAVTDHCGFFHEAAFYGSDDSFLAIVIPFLKGGVEAGEPTMVAMGGQKAELIRAALGDTSHISFPDAAAHYARPASVIKTYRELIAAHVARGAQQIRIVGDVPHPGTGQPWEWWARYEAAINHTFADFPVWGLCPYDTRVTPTDVLADVTRTHPHVATADGQHVPNARFEDPAEFLTHRPASGADPLEAAPPMIDLIDPTLAGARRAVLDASRVTHLDDTEVVDLVYAVNEVVTNAFCHGKPPVRLRIWTGPDRMVVTVTDRGCGPTDPFAGLLTTTNGASAGQGLWLVHQMCNHVTLGRDDEGFTIRLVAGIPGLPA
ncbi:MAG: anti-sigma factor RsbA family regulatory protein [Pseudonocardiales bacterium]